MRRIFVIVGVAAALSAVVAGPAAAAAADEPPAGCWGELTHEFAQTGELGEHASSFAPGQRVGLANLVDGGMSGLCEFLG